MSRIAKNPIILPSGVNLKIDGQNVGIKGANGSFDYTVHKTVSITEDEGKIVFAPAEGCNDSAWAMAGTMRSLVSNMIQGVSTGFERKLELVGVGYRAQLKGKAINLSLGFSHPVVYELPEGVTAELPSQTEIVLKGADKQALGQAAANIRAYRPPEPYKGKGVKYAGEHILRKEAKKK
ncbi:50S ribosomal protein L6 [Leucothrix arctica]|uniref:Large ribosomal subunit protein uL6 n=1 Tax=Leucothrix arctica TaxID=1481894 RepID=A0A317C6C7_9GAMM|nr:50S ribosomal protein L6 [Leucothrix arctica]PWQ94158.1 50S ribosomal protein L6 [Leucothrix arctica]